MPYTLEQHSQDYAAETMGAPAEVARAYAAYVVECDEAGDFGELGAYHPDEWRRWSGRHLADCLQCGSRWALRRSGCFECQDCGCARS